jgi:O-antigen/teichoic acid export membrane protein
MQTESLSKKVSKGMVWVVITSFLVRGLQIVSAIIVARLLLPADFGAIAVCMAVLTFAQGATDMGFLAALIQRIDWDDSYLNTAWTIELLRAAVIALFLIVTAPLFGIFFKNADITGLLRLLSLSILFQGLNSIGLICLRKDLDFYRLSISEIIPTLVQVLLVIPLAYFLKNAWAIAISGVFSSLVACMISYMLHPYRPRLVFERKKALNMFHYGKWVFGTTILVMIAEQGTTMVAGYYLGMVVLGYYNRATVFSKQISQQIAQFVWRMGFPLYSQLQIEEDKLKDVYFSTMKLLLFIGFPLAGLLLVLSREFTLALLTEKWLAIVPLMQLFGVLSFFLFMLTPMGVLFSATGKPSVNTKLSCLSVGMLLLFIVPFIRIWGASGVVMSFIISTAIAFPIQLYMVISIFKFKISEHIRIFFISILNTFIMVCSIYFLRIILSAQVSLDNFVLLGFFGVLAYLLSSYVSDKVFNYGLFGLIYSRITALKS